MQINSTRLPIQFVYSQSLRRLYEDQSNKLTLCISPKRSPQNRAVVLKYHSQLKNNAIAEKIRIKKCFNENNKPFENFFSQNQKKDKFSFSMFVQRTKNSSERKQNYKKNQSLTSKEAKKKFQLFKNSQKLSIDHPIKSTRAKTSHTQSNIEKSSLTHRVQQATQYQNCKKLFKNLRRYKKTSNSSPENLRESFSRTLNLSNFNQYSKKKNQSFLQELQNSQLRSSPNQPQQKEKAFLRVNKLSFDNNETSFAKKCIQMKQSLLQNKIIQIKSTRKPLTSYSSRKKTKVSNNISNLKSSGKQKSLKKNENMTDSVISPWNIQI